LIREQRPTKQLVAFVVKMRSDFVIPFSSLDFVSVSV